MNEDFEYLVKKNGPQAHSQPFDERDATFWAGRLPSGLIEFWRAFGVGTWAGGKFQFCRPDRYAEIVRIVLADDSDFNAEQTHLFGFGAFGDLLLWNEKRQRLSINLPYLEATADATQANWKAIDPNIACTSTLVRVGRDDQFTLFENTDSAAPLFKKCAQRLGEPEPGECYGLFPALALGGSTDINSVKRVKALEHFSILAQLGPVRLVDYSGGSTRYIRNLGAQG